MSRLRPGSASLAALPGDRHLRPEDLAPGDERKLLAQWLAARAAVTAAVATLDPDEPGWELRVRESRGGFDALLEAEARAWRDYAAGVPAYQRAKPGRRAQLEPGEAAQIFRGIFSSRAAGMMLLDADGTIVDANGEAGQITGFNPSELIGTPYWRFFPPEDRESVDRHRVRLVGGQSGRVTGERRLIRRDRSVLDVAISVAPVLDDSGQVVCLGVLLTDVSAARSLEQAQAQRVHDLRQLTVATQEMLAAPPCEIRALLCRHAVTLSGADAVYLLEPDDSGRWLVETARAPEEAHVRLRMARDATDGSPVGQTWGSGRASFVSDALTDPRVPERIPRMTGKRSALLEQVGTPGRRLGVLALTWREPRPARPEHVTELVPLLTASAALVIERADMHARLKAAAGTDPLTGLLNGRAWEEAVSRMVAYADRSRERLAVVCMDLHEFASANQYYGQEVADSLLAEVGEAWRGTLRHGDLLARVGPGEFRALLLGADQAGADRAVEQVAAATPSALRVVMAAVARRDGESAADLLARAAACLPGAQSDPVG
jgi:diguanylate cyclase (GGDEF)-like protein/PAS domain S-box-containing protein